MVHQAGSNQTSRSPGGVVANVLNCDLVVIQFELPSRYYVHFWFITLGENMNLLIPLVIC